MSIYKVKVQQATAENFKPYGTLIDFPKEEPSAVSAEFSFWPKVAEYKCDSGRFQIGVAVQYHRPMRICSLERHYHTQEFQMGLNGAMVIVFVKNKGMQEDENPAYKEAEAFLFTKEQGMVINAGVWHWSPLPVEGDLTLMCSFAWDTEKTDVIRWDLPAGEVLQLEL